MKKTLLATAIAGALGASAAAQAATVYNQDGTQLDIYGNLQIAYRTIESADYDEAGNRSVDSQDDIFDNGSTFGVAGQHVINPGLTGYFKAEWEFTADEAKGEGRGIEVGDQAYMGLQGNFGDVRLGSWDALIDDWVQDPISNNEYFDVTDSSVVGDDGINTQRSGSSDREGDKLQYLSPSFGGLQFAVGTQYKGDLEGGYEENDDGAYEQVGENIDSSGNASFYGGAKYTMGAFSVAAVYDNLDNFDGEVTGNTYLPDGTEFDAGDQYGVTFEYTMDALRMALKVERYESDDTDYLPDETRYALGGRYGYGFGDVYASYQYVDVGGDFGDWSFDNNPSDDDYDVEDDNRNEFIIGATYNLSSSMYTFVEAAWYDQEEDLGDGVAVGAVYAF